ncbi:transcriptional regulator [Candidatus Entotheonella serta]|nr:transcriptional regulator [Candidatus Entotheonella serta]
MDVDGGHPIKVVVRRTGLSPHVIRVWEKRYQAVEPMRTDTNRRRYSDADIERLLLLQRATHSGRSIGQIAHLTTERLRELVHEDESASPLPASPAPVAVHESAEASEIEGASSHLEACLEAIRQLDATALEHALMQARVTLSQPKFLEHLLVPLMETVGELWRNGTLRIVHEHLASTVVRSMLGGASTSAALSAVAPKIVVTTPTGQLHEIGALIVASIAEMDGWHVVYLGVNLPAEEIAAAVQHHGAKVVALSVVHPADDPRLADELIKLRRYLVRDIEILVGGRGSHGYQAVLDTIEATQIHALDALRTHLETLRSLGA